MSATAASGPASSGVLPAALSSMVPSSPTAAARRLVPPMSTPIEYRAPIEFRGMRSQDNRVGNYSAAASILILTIQVFDRSVDNSSEDCMENLGDRKFVE